MSDDLRDKIAATLREHRRDDGYTLAGHAATSTVERYWNCSCHEWSASYPHDHRDHLADAVLPLVREAQAEARRDALNEAADVWQRGEWADAPRLPERPAERIANSQYVLEWLRARAEVQP